MSYSSKEHGSCWARQRGKNREVFMRKQQHNITSKLLTVLFIILALPVTIFFMVQHARPVQSAVSLIHYTVYEGSLTSGWKAQSWASAINLANTSPVYSGSRSIAFTPTRRGAGLYLYTSRGVDTRLYSFFHFATQASQAGQDYNLTLYGGNDNMLSKVRLVNSVPGTWNVYTIPLSKLRANAKYIGGIALQSRTRSHGTLYIDSIGFIGLVSSPTPIPTDPPSPTPIPPVASFSTPIPTDPPSPTPIPPVASFSTPIPTDPPSPTPIIPVASFSTPIPTDPPSPTPTPPVASFSTPISTDPPSPTPIPPVASFSTPIPTVPPSLTPTSILTPAPSTGNIITIDPSSNAGSVNPFDWAIAAPAREIWDANSSAVIQRIKDANIKLIRIGAVQYSNMHLGGQTCSSPTNCNFSDMDKILKAIFDAAAEPLFLFAGYPGGFPTHDWQSYATFMKLVVTRYNVDLVLGKKITYWQAWNEPGDEPDGTIPTPQEYATMVKTVVGAMKSVDPTIKVLGPVAPFADLGSNGWVSYTAQNTNNLIDDLDWHNYGRHDDTDQARLSKEQGQYYNDFMNVETGQSFVSPTGKHYGVAMTEYNMAGQPLANGNNQEFRTNYNAVFVASAIMYAIKAQADIFSMFLLAQSGANTLGILDYQNNWAPFTPYYAFYLFGNHSGTTMLSGTGGTGTLEFVASKAADGKTVHVIVLNKDVSASQDVTISLTGAASGTYTQYQLDANHIPTTGTTGSYANGRLTFTMPATSVEAFDISL